MKNPFKEFINRKGPEVKEKESQEQLEAARVFIQSPESGFSSAIRETFLKYPPEKQEEFLKDFIRGKAAGSNSAKYNKIEKKYEFQKNYQGANSSAVA